MDEILDKLERGDFDRPNQKANLILQIRKYIKQLEKENKEYKWQEHLLNEFFTGTNYNAKEIIKLLNKLTEVINILKGRVCVHNGYICYAANADIPLTKQETELLIEVLGND